MFLKKYNSEGNVSGNRNYNLRAGRKLFYQSKFFFSFILICLSGSLSAQFNQRQIEKKWSFSLTLIVNKESVRDKNFSSLVYSGVNPGGEGSLKYNNGKVSHELEVYYTGGSLRTALKGTYLKNSYLNFDYANLYRITSMSTAFTCRAGGGLDVLYARRVYNNFINNISSFEFGASISGKLEMSYFFKNIFRGFSISDQITVPFISSIEQPAFGNENPGGDINNNGSAVKVFLNSNRIESFESFFRLKNQFSIEKLIAGNQKLCINYIWDYYQISNSREVKQVNDRFGFSYSFTL